MNFKTETVTNEQIAEGYKFWIKRDQNNLDKRKQTLKDILNPSIKTEKWQTKERFEALITKESKELNRKKRFIKKYL